MFQEIFQEYLAPLDTAMRESFDRHLSPSGLNVMMKYAMGWVDKDNQPYHEPTGKRLRPIFVFLCNSAAGGRWQDTMAAGVAVELLHNFSLIHDDIEDNSPIRHNRPTVWKVWGVPDAINAGDAMFTLAYAALTDLKTGGLSAERTLNIVEEFNRTNIALTRGQFLDMNFEKRQSVTIDEYIDMIGGKSASLLSFCSRVGAMVAKDDLALAKQFASFGTNLGIAFQMRDDILGIWGDPSVTGKSVASDIISRKKSLPVLYGLEKHSGLQEIYFQDQLTDEDVHMTVQILDECGALDYTRAQEEKYYSAALASLDATQLQNEAMGTLRKFVDLLFNRNY